jgi:hypothetical protein
MISKLMNQENALTAKNKLKIHRTQMKTFKFLKGKNYLIKDPI